MRFIQFGQLVLGVWVIVAPWILGYASLAPALWGSVVAGTLVALLALWALYGGFNHKNDISQK